MSHVLLDRRDLSLEYATDCLIVRSKSEPPRSIPLSHMEQLICLHSVTLTTQLIGQLLKHGIDLIVINQRHADHGFSLFADPAKQAQRRCHQYAWQQFPQRRLPLAKELCAHKLHVATRLLRTLGMPADQIKPLERTRYQLSTLRDEAALRGAEGNAQRHLFQVWRRALPSTLGFTQRQRRPPPDPVNALLSLTYTLIHQEAIRRLKASGMDPMLGFYHRLASGRNALACDLMEPLRPLAEAWVVALFCDGYLDRRHFSVSDRGCLLGKQGRACFYSRYEQELPHWQRILRAAAHWLARKLDAVDAPV